MGRIPRAWSSAVYGLRIKSPWPLGGLRVAARPEVELVDEPAPFGAAAAPGAGSGPPAHDRFHYARLPDGSDYLQWSRLFEFLISPEGRRIECRALGGARRDTFRTYLLGQVLSFALVKRGVEPLHATAVVIGGRAVGFLGDCGYGKSSLGAAFVREGYRLLTDDVLVVTQKGPRFVAYPGVPRIKLFPTVARRLLRDRRAGTPMNNRTTKLVIPLGRRDAVAGAGPWPLQALYVLAPPRADTSAPPLIRRMTPRRALVALIRNTFNTVVVDPARLARQLDQAARLALTVPIRSLAFPRRFASLPLVRDAILADLAACPP